jgi:DHA1 family multidrug resistance protein-like MFS transporter
MNTSLGWRWTHYISGILGAVSFLSLLAFLRESYAPVLLIKRAEILRRETGNWAIHARHEEVGFEWQNIVKKYLSRPLRMLAFDPIVLILSCFMGYVYGLLYLFLTAYPIVFQKIHGMSPGIGGLPYLALIAGQCLAGLSIHLMQPSYVRKIIRNRGKSEPEWRLPIAIPGSIAFSAGLFWLGWTGNSATIHWILPTLSGLFTGYGLLAMFLPPLSYLIEVYGIQYDFTEFVCVANFGANGDTVLHQLLPRPHLCAPLQEPYFPYLQPTW